MTEEKTFKLKKEHMAVLVAIICGLLATYLNVHIDQETQDAITTIGCEAADCEDQ